MLFTALCCLLSSVLHCMSITWSSAKMPWYDVEHAIALTQSQCDVLAEKITSLHAHTFMVPALLVNIQFRDASKDNTYVAGQRKLSIGFKLTCAWVQGDQYKCMTTWQSNWRERGMMLSGLEGARSCGLCSSMADA